MRFRIVMFVGLLVACTQIAISRTAYSCGHDGFYFGGGYMQPFYSSSERQISSSGVASDQIHFGPAVGAFLVGGYDFCGSRFGVQMPVEWSTFVLNRAERVHLFGSSVEAVTHLVAWENGLDINVVGGMGWNYLTEGEASNQTRSFGVNFGAGPGLAWYFSQAGDVTGALKVELPIRAIIFLGDHLSANQTTVLAVLLRIGVTVGF